MERRLTIGDLHSLKKKELRKTNHMAYKDFTSYDLENLKDDESITSSRYSTILDKCEQAGLYNKEGEAETPIVGIEYLDPNTGEIKVYVPLDDLRSQIVEMIKRNGLDDFVLGRKVWGRVITRIGLGYKDGSSFIPHDDIDTCYKAYNPSSGYKGFNLACIDRFFKEYSEKIIKSMKLIEREDVIDEQCDKEDALAKKKSDELRIRRKLALQQEEAENE